jgi:phage protein U
MYAQLGNIQFELLPIESFDERYSYNYAEHQVIEGKPLLQFVGDNLDEANISVRFHFAFCDPEAQFALLKEEADRHEALPFSFTSGKYLGYYIISEISKTTVVTADNGYALCIEARLQLKEWSDPDPMASHVAAQKRKALGLSGKGSLAKSYFLTNAQNRTALIAGQVKANAGQMNNLASRISTLADDLKATYAGTAAGISSQVKAAADQIKEQTGPMMAQAQSLAAGVQGAAANIQVYAAQVSGISSSITRVLSGLPGPAAKLGQRMEALNKGIATQAESTITLSQLAQGGAIEAGQRAQIITRMLPG